MGFDVTEDELVMRLADMVSAGGGITQWSRTNGVPSSVVSDTLRRIRRPAPQVLDAMGFYKVEADYQPKQSADAS